MANPLAAIGAFFSAISSALALVFHRSKLKNTPAQKANSDAARDLREKEKIENVIEESERTGNLNEERKHFAE